MKCEYNEGDCKRWGCETKCQAMSLVRSFNTYQFDTEPLGAWLSAALSDPKVCDEFKADINRWLEAEMPPAGCLVPGWIAARLPEPYPQETGPIPKKTAADVVTSIDGDPTGWVAVCPGCHSVLHITKP